MKTIFKLVLPAILILTLLLPGSVLAKDKSLIVGGKDYTEQLLLPELASILLEQAGFRCYAEDRGRVGDRQKITGECTV